MDPGSWRPNCRRKFRRPPIAIQGGGCGWQECHDDISALMIHILPLWRAELQTAPLHSCLGDFSGRRRKRTLSHHRSRTCSIADVFAGLEAYSVPFLGLWCPAGWCVAVYMVCLHVYASCISPGCLHAHACFPPLQVEGHQCHRVAHAHRKLMLKKKFVAASPNKRFTEGEHRPKECIVMSMPNSHA